MMSDFMFPIYLATNKIQKRRKSEGHRERSEEKTEKREARGRPRKTRERQS